MDKEERTIRHFFEGNYTKEDAEQFFCDIRDPEKAELIDSIMKEQEEESRLRKESVPFRYELYKQEAQDLLRYLNEKRRVKFRQVAVYVASIASVFMLAYVLLYVKNGQMSSDLYTEIVTSCGEKRRLTFSDSTRVMLNSRTNIVYPQSFGKKERRVRLSGEAYFKVNKDKTPFIVETERFDIQVLGTAFNVKAYDEDEIVSVEVSEGHVKVSMPGASFSLKRKEKVILNNRTGEIIKEVIQNDSRSFGWMDGRLYFDRTPIRDIARDLERIYGCRIVFKEGEEFNNLISGEHDNESLENVLQSIECISGVRYLKKDNEILLYK